VRADGDPAEDHASPGIFDNVFKKTYGEEAPECGKIEN